MKQVSVENYRYTVTWRIFTDIKNSALPVFSVYFMVFTSKICKNKYKPSTKKQALNSIAMFYFLALLFQIK